MYLQQLHDDVICHLPVCMTLPDGGPVFPGLAQIIPGHLIHTCLKQLRTAQHGEQHKAATDSTGTIKAQVRPPAKEDIAWCSQFFGLDGAFVPSCLVLWCTVG